MRGRFVGTGPTAAYHIASFAVRNKARKDLSGHEASCSRWFPAERDFGVMCACSSRCRRPHTALGKAARYALRAMHNTIPVESRSSVPNGSSCLSVLSPCFSSPSRQPQASPVLFRQLL